MIYTLTKLNGICLLILFFIICINIPTGFANTANSASKQPYAERTQGVRALPGDSVQSVLRLLAMRSPGLVSYIPETGRLFLTDSRESVLSPALLMQLQDAFYYDIHQWCKFYGEKYLLDWRVLLAKASRETCWGTSYLCNRANNYFGIRKANKVWACESFRYCEVVVRPDPEPAEFVVFPSFQISLWMFIHTIYSPHFLERLPDMGARVYDVIRLERQYGLHYWQFMDYGLAYPRQLMYTHYTAEDIIYTWSEHPINNLCLNCSRQTDREWVNKVQSAAFRAGI